MNRTRYRLLGWIALSLFLGYFLFILIYGWITDWQPGPEPLALAFDQRSEQPVLTDSVCTLAIWNVGFGGLGAESDFFYDDEGLFYSGNSMVRSPRPLVEKNLQGVLRFFQAFRDSVDFFLIQEADVQSDRSYGILQYQAYQQALPGFAANFAPNYQCKRVPIPLLEPWNAYGSVHSGLATFSRIQPLEAVRHQLPGHHPMPDRLFQLDRCASLQRYKTSRGKDLVIINLHNSAYDPGDQIKAIQLPYLRDLALAEYARGNYVVLGGDWNQCPPNFVFNSFMSNKTTEYRQGNLPADYFPSDWTFGYDPSIPTNRKAKDAYKKGETFETLIDFFLVSPNVQIQRVKGINQGFQYSDHQPVLLTIALRNE